MLKPRASLPFPRRSSPAATRLDLLLLLAGGMCAVSLFQTTPNATAQMEAPSAYVVHDFGPRQISGINDLNASNVGCGYTYLRGAGGKSFYHAALFVNGQQIDLGTLGGKSSSAFALNEHGQVVGEAQTRSGAWHAFRWSDANGDRQANPGEMRDLGVGSGDASRAVDINNRGEVVGLNYRGLFKSRQPFLWKNGAQTRLVRPGAALGTANWIGDDGTILGDTRHRTGNPVATRWRDGPVGEALPLDRFRGYDAHIVGRSDTGEIWLNLNTDGEFLPCVFRKRKLQILPRLLPTDIPYVIAVNRNGIAVGAADAFRTYRTRCILWSRKNAYELNDLLLPNSGFSMVEVSAINDAGWIVGAAMADGNETVHSVVLQPVTRE